MTDQDPELAAFTAFAQGWEDADEAERERLLDDLSGPLEPLLDEEGTSHGVTPSWHGGHSFVALWRAGDDTYRATILPQLRQTLGLD